MKRKIDGAGDALDAMQEEILRLYERKEINAYAWSTLSEEIETARHNLHGLFEKLAPGPSLVRSRGRKR
jgi:hypothetical protein